MVRIRFFAALKTALEHVVTSNPVEVNLTVKTIKVTYLDKQPMGYHLEEKEKEVLRSLGKISKDELEKLIVDDLPSEWRLACQFIPRDEDVVVEYEAQ